MAQTSHAASDNIFIETYEENEDLVVEIKALDMTTPVIGIAFDLYYDSYTLSYKSYDAGGFFEQGGEPIYMIAPSIDSKGEKIISGITLKRTDQQVSSGETIISFYFDILKKETAKFEFDHHVISTLQDGKRLDLPEITWTDSEANLEKQETQEEISKVEVQKTEAIQTNESVKTTEVGATDMIYADIFKRGFAAIGLLPIAMGICYILWRYYKKKYAKKTDTCIAKPKKKEPDEGAWTEI